MNYPANDDPFARKATRNWSFGRQTQPGTGIRGKITAIGNRKQSTKYNPDPNATKVLEWWDDEKTRPKEYVTLSLQTALNEPTEEFPVDDGLRNIAIDLEYKQGGKMNAIQEAVKAAGGQTVQVGGDLALWFTGLDPDSKNPDQPRKLFAATYALPVGDGAQAFGAPPQGQQPPQYGGAQPPQYGGGGMYNAQQQAAPSQHDAAANALNQQRQAAPPAWTPESAAAAQQGTPPAYGGPGTTAYTNAGQQGGYPPQGQAPNPYGQQPSNVPYNTNTGEVNPQSYPEPVPAAPPQGQQPPPVDPEQVKARLRAGQVDAQISAEMNIPLETVAAIRNFAGLQASTTQDPPY